jgi:TonB family protein
MKLAGDLAEFSLADLVQVAGIAGRTCSIRVLAAEGSGTLILDRGELVGAAYENLAGFDALVALLAARAGHFQVENGESPGERNLKGNVQKLLFEANGRIEAGNVPRPRPRVLPTAAAAGTAAAGAPATGRNLWIGGGLAAVVLIGAVGWLAFARQEVASRGAGGSYGDAAGAGSGHAGSAAPVSGSAPAAPPAVEATQLNGPGDTPPTLLAGPPATPPDPSSSLRPTVVCRLLVDANGRVADAQIYRSRLDLSAFEDAALDAVRKYRFTPGRKAGAAVAVRINWPVTFH